MHGRLKVKTTEEKQREKQEADRKKAIKLSELIKLGFKLKQDGDISDKGLKVTAEILTVNADCYTFWNYRREIIKSMLSISEDVTSLVTNELTWIESVLRQYSKSYWVWFHRQWISQYIKMDWKRELELCYLMHQLDSRNFHCWNYRRFVLSQANIDPHSELEMALKLIESNFSNYSAWHHRSVFLPKAHEGNKDELKQELLNEFERVKAAFYTSPEDQSAWFYHRWLVGIFKNNFPEDLEPVLKDQLQSCLELLEIEENSKWTLLTIIFLMKDLKSSQEELHSKVESLIQCDPLRIGFYKDLENSV